MRTIRVDWFKPSGKWYAGQELEIGNYNIWQKEFFQDIVNNQSQLVDSWIGHFDVVTGDLQKYDNDSTYEYFPHAIFRAEKFIGLKREKI